MQVPVLSGVYTDETGDFRTSYPQNLVPIPAITGIAQGYLRPADGITQFATGPGTDRGGINWRGTCYRVMGTKLVSVSSTGVITEIGEVGDGAFCRFDYSFDRLGIVSDTRLYYYDGATLTQVTDSDLGPVLDMVWVDGYFMTTDGSHLVVTELADPTQVNPLKYGSSEGDPDPVVALRKVHREVYALNRYTVEVFSNVGGEFFPFERVPGALIPRGAVGTRAVTPFMETLAYVGSGRNEPPAVWWINSYNPVKLSTREIDRILQSYSEYTLSQIVTEVFTDKNQQCLKIHLPDKTLVYDGSTSRDAQTPVWYVLHSGLVNPTQYRARGFVWCYDRWIFGDPTDTTLGTYTSTVSTHYGDRIGWEFGTAVLFNEGRGAIVHNLELHSLPGYVPTGVDPTIWTSYSLDGLTWSQEHPAKAGKQGQYEQRITWRRQGRMRRTRIQKFRGTSDAHLSLARLEATVEPLNG